MNKRWLTMSSRDAGGSPMIARWWRPLFCGALIAGVASTSAGAQSLALPAIASGYGVSEQQAKAPARRAPAERTIALDLRAVPLEDAIAEIGRRSGAAISYSKATLPKDHRVTLRTDSITAEAALRRVLQGTALRVVTQSSGRLVVTAGKEEERRDAADGTIVGRITDAITGRPIPGVTIALGNSAKSVVTDGNGIFRITGVAEGEHVISARILGYGRQSKTVTVAEGAVTVDFVLTASASPLDQVVVTGTVVATEQKAVPNAMTVFTAQDIEARGITHIEQLLRGDVPGVFAINQGSGAFLGEVNTYARGATMLSSGIAASVIKTYVDGVEMADPRYLSQIDPRSVERIEIVAGPQASTIYGSNAMNGVMQIFTKRGRTARPRLNASWQSGWIQNAFTSALAPQHNASLQVDGTEGKASYQLGGNWEYAAPWVSAQQRATTSGYAGARFNFAQLLIDGSLRRARTLTFQGGPPQPMLLEGIQEGTYGGLSLNPNHHQDHLLNSQTLSGTITYTPVSWWSHNLVLGSDVSNTEIRRDRPTYGSATSPSDTLLYLSQNQNSRTSWRYTTTAQVPLTSYARGTFTIGADRWDSRYANMWIMAPRLDGMMTGTPSWTRTPNHNTGALFQGQVDILDRLFLTYGIRSEWNPNYGEEANPNLAPRYGVSYVYDGSVVTIKARLSYGRATRPPAAEQKLAVPQSIAPFITIYGPHFSRLANPDLGPEYQQGGEGGLEVYIGNRGSVVVTRYNQTVDALIATPAVDSIPRLDGRPGKLGITQSLNVGSIRNQGWELQGSLATGPLTTRVTYTYAKSRVLGITPKYRDFLRGTQYIPGGSFTGMPEHVWAMAASYARGPTAVTLDVQGVGQLFVNRDALTFALQQTRLMEEKLRLDLPSGYRSRQDPFALANLSVSHRLTRALESTLNIRNLGDRYDQDYDASYANMGRQTRLGLRIRL